MSSFDWRSLLGATLLVSCSNQEPAAQGGSGAQGGSTSTGPSMTSAGGGDSSASSSSAGNTSSGGTSSSGGNAGVGGTEQGGGSSVPDPGSLSADSRLYTTDGSEFLIDEAGEAFVHAMAAGPDNLILYVHGRGCGGGGEPQKSLSGAMPELESDYSAAAIMFNWPGSDVGCPLGFPEDEARAAGQALAHTLHVLAYFKSQNAGLFSGLRLTLITHSMGSLVLEQALTDDPLPLPSSLFHTAMIGSAASARSGHASWLTKATLSEALYVSVNAGDNVLTAAAALGGARLGKSVAGEPLATNALYVDFTASDVNHAYYLHSGQNGAHMTGFYDQVMNGLPFDFSATSGVSEVEERDGTFIYHFDGN